MLKRISCIIFMLVLLTACGADHSRNFTINIDADGTDPWVELDIDSLFEKADNTEESTTENDLKGELSIPITAVP